MIISFYIITEKMKTKNIFKKSLIIAVLSFAICILLSNTNSYAAKKTTATFSDGYKSYYFAINDSVSIKIKNKQKKASYSFTSSNKKVATVSKKGVVKGVSAGKAKIVVNQILKKKKTKIATLTVKVEKAVLYVDLDRNIKLSNQPGYYKNSKKFIPTQNIAFRNKKAKYTVTSSKPKILSLTSTGKIKKIKNFTGTNKVKVTFKETYKKKTRKVGTINVTIGSPSYTGKKDVTIYKYETYNASENCNYLYGKFYTHISKDETIIDPNTLIKSGNDNNDDVLDSDNIVFKGLSAGKRYIHLYLYDYNTKKYITTPFAQFTITVKTVDTANKLKVDFSSYNDDDYDDEEVSKFNYSDKTNTLTITNHYFKSFGVYTTPCNYTGEVTATSSNPDVVSIVDIHNNLYTGDDYYGDSDYYDEEYHTEQFSLITLAPGTSTITLKANGAETSFNVVVKETIYNTGDEFDLDIPLDTPIHIDSDDDYEYYDDFSVKSSNRSIIDFVHVSEIHDISNNIHACRIGVETGYQSGPVTLTVLYKGKEVGSVTINVNKSDKDNYDDYDY